MHILVIRPGAIGDALLTFPILNALREQHPSITITLVSNANILPLALASGLVEQVSDYQDLQWSELFSTTAIERGRAKSSPYELLQDTDLAICWLRDPDGIVKKNLLEAGAKHVIVAPGRPPEGEQVHIVDYLAQTIGLQNVADGRISRGGSGVERRGDPWVALRALVAHDLSRGGSGVERRGDPWVALRALPTNHVEWRMWVHPPRATQGSPLHPAPLPPLLVLHPLCFGCLRPAPGRPVAIHPGSGGAQKCWPTSSFASIIEQLIHRNIPVLLLAGPADAGHVKIILDLLIPQPAPAMLKILENAPLLEVARHLQECACYLGNDSGITHLAAMLGVPTIALFGPSDPVTWRPLGPFVHVIQEHPLEQLHPDMVMETLNTFYSS